MRTPQALEAPNTRPPRAARVQVSRLPGPCCHAQVTPRVALTANLHGYRLEEVVRLSKRDLANATQTLSLDIGMDGTDVYEATWTIDASSVPFWLSPSNLSGVIGATDQTGMLTLVVNATGVPERIDPYTAPLNLSVASQRDKSFLVLVTFYVSAPTLASTTEADMRARDSSSASALLASRSSSAASSGTRTSGRTIVVR